MLITRVQASINKIAEIVFRASLLTRLAVAVYAKMADQHFYEGQIAIQVVVFFVDQDLCLIFLTVRMHLCLCLKGCLCVHVFAYLFVDVFVCVCV